jgi:DNA-entry nuclease
MRKTNKRYREIKQILLLIIAIAIVVTTYFNRQYIETDNITNTSNNIESYKLTNVPAYSSEPYAIINNNIPDFEESYFTSNCFENYSNLDELGRCGVAFANLGKETMPSDNEKRTSISNIYPSGWKNKEYDTNLISGGYLYNRCHLIAYALSAENANEKNLITGTKYLNINGMLPFETKVINYLKENQDKHVLYRVTPIFEGSNLVVSGVQIEAESVEDKGESICFNVYAYNVQPGIKIDYSTGDSQLEN